ncbi:MAG: GerMN domain-containing protein, partial [Oscillospiraceae bacterium]|nr:GerMN domain-containing protein [Oscillospiraceae bacterium]
IIFSSCGDSPDFTAVKIYFVDSEMLRLLPIETYIPNSSAQHQAKTVLNELIRGRDDNPKIKRVIPDIEGCMTVKVKDGAAYIDISKEMAEAVPESRDLELLTIYSIVNSITSVEGISTVRFTIDKQVTKDFSGFLDMRETFIPDYFI